MVRLPCRYPPGRGIGRAWAILDALVQYVHSAGCVVMARLRVMACGVCRVVVCVGEVAKVLSPCAVVCGVCWDRSHVVCE